jgi:dTDP-4-amino-4,6-dideoxygalactose transaminase/glycosyltransferase involved in cell wall biosynthesis
VGKTVSPDVTIVLPNLGGGGAERITVNLAQEFAARGLNVEIVLLGGGGVLEKDLSPAIGLQAMHATRFRWSLFPFIHYVFTKRPKSILAAMPPVTWIAVAARLFSGSRARVVIAEHFDWDSPRSSPPNPHDLGFRTQMWMAYRGADVRVAVSGGVAASAARLAGVPVSSIDVVYNPVTPLPPAGEMNPDIARAWLGRKGCKLIAVGSFKAAKDYPNLFHAVARVRETQPVSLLVLGDGEIRGEMERLRKALGLEDCIDMPGFVANPGAYLEKADLFVLSSLGEGLPTVLIEALACGTPVVSTDCLSGPREILKDGTFGTLVPVQDSDALAVAIVDSLGRDHDRAALVRRADDFSTREAADKYLKLLLPSLASQPAPAIVPAAPPNDRARIPATRPYLPSRATYLKYVEGIYDRCWLTNNGPLVRELTARLEDRLGVRNLLLVANGTLALQIAFKALDIKHAAVTSPFTFVATASALQWEGIKPVFADTDPGTLNLDPAAAEAAITEGVTGLVPVHVYGNPCDVEGLDALAKRKGLKVVYDAAHAFSVDYRGESLLRWGDAATLSLHATKLFHTGEGGAIVFKDRDALERAARMINFGIDISDGSIVDQGINAKLSELQAAMGLAMLDDVDKIVAARRAIVELYRRELNGPVEFQEWSPHANRNGAYAPVLLKDEAQCLRVIAQLLTQGVEPRRYFYPPLARAPLFEHGAVTPHADATSRRVLCLPIYYELADRDIVRICDVVKSTIGG